MKRKSLRVVKLGGSLLGYDRLRERFAAWIGVQPVMKTVIVAGGGPLVEAIRQLDAIHGFSDVAAHWAAVDALGVAARVVAELFPKFPLVEQVADLDQHSDDTLILDVSRVLKESSSAAQLPWSWDVTSDSIAAWVAKAIEADELVLLKSGLPLGGLDLEGLADEGYVDAYFPTIAADCEHLRLVNLRDPAFGEERVSVSRQAMLGRAAMARGEGNAQ